MGKSLENDLILQQALAREDDSRAINAINMGANPALEGNGLRAIDLAVLKNSADLAKAVFAKQDYSKKDKKITSDFGKELTDLDTSFLTKLEVKDSNCHGLPKLHH